METIITSVLGAVASSVVGSLFSDDEEPEQPKPVVMPEPDDEALRKAKRESMYQQLARNQSRSSTIMTDSEDSDSLG